MAKVKQITDLQSYQELRDAVATLARSDTVHWFFTIRRRRPNIDSLWTYWKRNLAVDTVDDIRELCYNDGGGQFEYKIRVHDLNGNKPKMEDGSELTDRVIPAIVESEKQPVIADDPLISERQKSLRQQKLELEIERQEAELERQRRRLEKQRNGEDDDEEEDQTSYYFPPPYGPGMPYQPGMPHGYNPYDPYGMPPWMKDLKKQDTSVELAKAFAPVLAAIVANNSGNKGDSLLRDAEIMKILMGSQNKALEPKDMLSFVSPLMAEMSKASTESSKLIMEKFVDSDQFWKEKIIEAARLGGADEDEIDKWRKIFGLASEAIGSATKVIFGRPTIMQGKPGTVNVPVIEKAKPPGIAGPKEATAKNPQAPEAPPDPEKVAKDVTFKRIEAFLQVHEQEMFIGSDPELVAEKLDELWFMLPEGLRTDINSLTVDKIYDLLHQSCPEIIGRILEAVKTDATGKRKDWCFGFWEAIKDMNRPEEGDGDDDEDAEEPEPSPEPESAQA